MSIDKIGSEGISKLMAKMIAEQTAAANPSRRSSKTTAGKKAEKSEAQNVRKAEKLRKAAQDFETIFLRHMLKAMRKTVGENDIFGNSSESRIYKEMLDGEMAEIMAKAGGIGLADMLIRQLGPALDETQNSGG